MKISRAVTQGIIAANVCGTEHFIFRGYSSSCNRLRIWSVLGRQGGVRCYEGIETKRIEIWLHRTDIYDYKVAKGDKGWKLKVTEKEVTKGESYENKR